MARYFPCVKYEDLSDILPHGGVTQEKVLNPLNALEILEGQVALVPHHGLRRGHSSSPRFVPAPEMESHLFGLFLGGSEPRPAHHYEAVRR